MKIITWFSILIATGFYICGPILDPDLWWHITIGKWIIANKEIPYVDYWNMFAVSKPWQAYSWSNEIVYAFIDDQFGILGLLSLKLILSILLAFSFFYCLGKISKDWFFGGLLGMYVTAACFNHFTLRPQALVWIYFISLIYTLELISTKGVNYKNLSAVFLIMLFWANTHLTTVIGIFTIYCWLAFRNSSKDLVFTLAVGFIGTLFTPYLGAEWITFLTKSSHPFDYSAIAEFKPANILQYSTAFILVLLAVLLLFLHFVPTLLSITKIVWGSILCIGGLAVVKFIPFAIIAIACLLARMWKEAKDKDSFGNFAEGIERLRKFYDWLPKEGLAFLFIVFGIINFTKSWNNPLGHEVIPVAAVDFIEEKNLEHPILNEFGRGGYLMYRFSDSKGELEHLVPIDGRTNVNSPEVWKMYLNAKDGNLKWQEYIDKVNPNTILWRTGSPFVSLLIAQDDWCLVGQFGSEKKGHSVLVKKEFYNQNKDDLESKNC